MSFSLSPRPSKPPRSFHPLLLSIHNERSSHHEEPGFQQPPWLQSFSFSRRPPGPRRNGSSFHRARGRARRNSRFDEISVSLSYRKAFKRCLSGSFSFRRSCPPSLHPVQYFLPFSFPCIIATGTVARIPRSTPVCTFFPPTFTPLHPSGHPPRSHPYARFARPRSRRKRLRLFKTVCSTSSGTNPLESSRRADLSRFLRDAGSVRFGSFRFVSFEPSHPRCFVCQRASKRY